MNTHCHHRPRTRFLQCCHLWVQFHRSHHQGHQTFGCDQLARGQIAASEIMQDRNPLILHSRCTREATQRSCRDGKSVEIFGDSRPSVCIVLERKLRYNTQPMLLNRQLCRIPGHNIHHNRQQSSIHDESRGLFGQLVFSAFVPPA